MKRILLVLVALGAISVPAVAEDSKIWRKDVLGGEFSAGIAYQSQMTKKGRFYVQVKKKTYHSSVSSISKYEGDALIHAGLYRLAVYMKALDVDHFRVSYAYAVLNTNRLRPDLDFMAFYLAGYAADAQPEKVKCEADKKFASFCQRHLTNELLESEARFLGLSKDRVQRDVEEMSGRVLK